MGGTLLKYLKKEMRRRSSDRRTGSSDRRTGSWVVGGGSRSARHDDGDRRQRRIGDKVFVVWYSFVSMSILNQAMMNMQTTTIVDI